eukprot:421175_1
MIMNVKLNVMVICGLLRIITECFFFSLFILHNNNNNMYNDLLMILIIISNVLLPLRFIINHFFFIFYNFNYFLFKVSNSKGLKCALFTNNMCQFIQKYESKFIQSRWYITYGIKPNNIQIHME